MTQDPDGLSPLPSERNDTPAMQGPAEPLAKNIVASRPPAHPGGTWVTAQLREALHRISATLTGPAEPPDPDPPPAGRDLEPEP